MFFMVMFGVMARDLCEKGEKRMVCKIHQHQIRLDGIFGGAFDPASRSPRER